MNRFLEVLSGLGQDKSMKSGKQPMPDELSVRRKYTDTTDCSVTSRYRETDDGRTVQVESVELRPTFELGDGFILYNGDHVFERIGYDREKGEHVFRNVRTGDEITVIEQRINKRMADYIRKSRMRDTSLARYWLEIDPHSGLEAGRRLQGEIQIKNDIAYGACSGFYDVRGTAQPVSVAVWNSHTLFIFGKSGPLIDHLRPSKAPWER